MWFKKKKKKLDIEADSQDILRGYESGEERVKPTEEIERPQIETDSQDVLQGYKKSRPDYQPTEEEQKPRAKPVDAMERERKRPIKSAGLSFLGATSQSLSLAGGAIESLGKKAQQRKHIPGSQMMGKAYEKAGRYTKEGFGFGAEMIREDKDYIEDYQTFRNEKGKFDVEKFKDPKVYANVIAQGLGSMAPILLSGGIGGISAVLGSAFLIEKGDAVDEYSQKLAKEKNIAIKDFSNEDVSNIDQSSSFYGIASSALEMIVPARFIKQIGKQPIKSAIKSIWKRVPIEAGRAILAEGGTEGLQRFTQNVISQLQITKDQKLGENVLDEAIAGALTGGAIGVVGGVMPVAEAPAPQKQEIEPEEKPAEPKKEQPKITENTQKVFGLLAEDDKEALTELLPKMSQEEILEVRNSLVKMERQGKKDALEDRKMIEDILIDRETKSNETAKKILEEGKLESLEELPLEDRKKVIGAVEKTKDETAVGEITKERETQTKLKEEKTKLLAERKAKPEQKKEIQAKIDKIDEQRRDEFVAEITPEAREGVAKTIKEGKGIKTLEAKKYEHKQKTTTKPKRISEPREAGKPEPKKVSDKTAEAREKQPVGRRVEEDGEVKMTEEEYLNSKGASRQGFGEAALHKNIQEGRAKRQALKRMSEKDEILTKKREKLRVEYAEKVKAGKIKTPTRIEQLINTAQGMKENKATQAARRLLRKKGISWESEVKKLKAKKKTYIEDRKKFVSSFIDSAEGEKAYQAVVEKEARLGVIGETDKTVISGIKNNSYYRKEKTIKDAMGNGHLLKKGNRYMIAEPKDLDRFVRNGWENVIEVDTLANEAGFASGEDYLNYTLEQLGKEESLSTLEKETHKILMEKDETYKTLNDEINNLTKQIYEKSKKETGEITDTKKKEVKYQKMTARELALDVQYSAQYEYINKEWQLKPIIEEQISSKEAIKIFRQFFTKEEMPIEVVERITTEDGGGAWASVTPELVKFIQNPKESTPYHEAVHAYLNKYATKKQWQELMDEVRKEKYGGKTEAKITNAELEEDLAEDFIGYVKTRKAPSSNIIKRFYDDVIKFLKKLVGKENKIEAFYEAIIEKKRPGYLQKTKLLLGKLRERELLYQRKRSKEYVEALKAMSKRDSESFSEIKEIAGDNTDLSFIRKDINGVESLVAQARDIYLKDKKEFVAAKMFEDAANDRRMDKADMDNHFSEMLKSYYDLNKKSLNKLNNVLMRGDIEGKKFNKTELAELGVKTKEEITAYYNVRKAFEEALDTLIDRMREAGVAEDRIADFQRTKIGYMPHKWEHRFVVKEQKQTEDGWQTISMEDFKKKRHAEKAWKERNRNEQANIRYVLDTLDSVDVDFFTEQRLSFDSFKSVITKVKAPKEARAIVLDALKDIVKEKGFGRHFIRRTGVEGYDMSRTPVIIADYFSGFNGYLTKMEAAPKYFQALEKVDPRRQKDFHRWLRDTIAYDMGNSPELNHIKTLAFTYYLANDISFLLTNSTQNFVVGVGELSKLSKGVKKIYQPETKLLGAMTDWWTQNISEEEKSSIKKLLDEGRLGAEMTAELMGFKNNPLYRSVSNILNKALFYSTAIVEQNINRVPAFLAARRILEDQGITGEELNKRALDVSDDIHFRYGKQHRPVYYRGRKGALFVFTHYIRSFMFQLSRDVKHREFVSLGRKMFYTSFFGGATALPFAGLIIKIYKEIVGRWDDDEDEELKEEVSRWETMYKKGVPASLGVDMSGRVAIDIFAIDSIANDPKNVAKWLGAAGGLVFERFPKGYEMAMQGRYYESAGKLLPDALGNVFRSYYGYEHGLRSSYGTPLETEEGEPFEYSFGEALVKGAGFTPTREAELYEARSEEYKKEKKMQKKKKRLKLKMEEAEKNGDWERWSKLSDELDELK